MNTILSVENLQKTFRVAQRRSGTFGALRGLLAPRYREVHAVDGVSFRLEPGELVGYLGPNGAGKSTTLKILTGLLVPSSGQVQVNGMVPWKERTRYVAQIGAVFGQRSTLWYDLPVIDSLELLQPMYRIPPESYRRNLDEFTALLEMEPFLNTPVRSLSLGQRMRADLCAALMHEPRLVFLDEPTIGLDVVAKERIRQFIQHIHKERGTTIILTTHDLSDIERLCERVMILDQGRLLYDGNLDSLVERFEGPRRVSVTFAEEYTTIDLPGLPAQSHEGRRATYLYNWRQTSVSHVIARLLENFRIADLEVERPPVEETIRRIYEQRLLEN